MGGQAGEVGRILGRGDCKCEDQKAEWGRHAEKTERDGICERWRARWLSPYAFPRSRAWVQILPLPLPGRVTLGKLALCSESPSVK